eukprot:TRINITY_DN34132_c0_g1_i1.p1 TRINITY_DN34132_c0_g1~~TRINITY_DN34132_c0_g1_i1.p1  ORF type:complete len:872 (+),score=223.88 TRINITY_DN34132_c0_g1_i1:70-2616(+)
MTGMDSQIVKRNGKRVPLDESKIRARIARLLSGLDEEYVKVDAVLSSVMSGVSDSMSSQSLDNLLAEQTAYLGTRHPDYSRLAGRLSVTNLHKRTLSSFSETCKVLFRYIHPQSGAPAPLLSKKVFELSQEHAERLDAAIDHTRDYRFDYFGFKTLERSYLLRVDGRKIAERPQHLWMRVSLGIHQEDLDRVIETYDYLSTGKFIHASPTLFAAGTPVPQLSSCFLVAMKDDSIEGIYDTLKQTACISKAAGGIGLHVHNIRAHGSYISGTNGTSNGIVPMLRVFNATARYVDQGGGKRKGAFAVYLEPWHADVMDYLQLKKNTGKEEARARDLFYALWIPDLFMKRVEKNEKWSLMCPKESPGLADCHGEEFEKLYAKYEAEGKFRHQLPAREVWMTILESQIETGTPYMLYKDAANAKSNHRHLGTIKCSNLCTEIIEYTSAEETAVCNLASMSLPAYVNTETNAFDHEALYRAVRVVTRNLNRVIDINWYPTKETRTSNFRHRPVGIGVQGLADVFLMLRLPFCCDEAKMLNEAIFETIYYASMDMSCDLAKERGSTYETYVGSPVSQGQLQFDMWGRTPASGRWDWTGLRQRIKDHGLLNSLLVAPMPTASTSQILGNNECFEPFTSNIYLRRCLSGEFPVVNKYLVRDLAKLGLWNESVRNQIIAYNGSVRHIDLIPQHLKEIYRTVWELKQRDLIDMAVARAAFIDQSQSLNLFVEEPTAPKLTSMHFHAWKNGLKTGMYYLRTRPAAEAIKFTVDAKVVAAATARLAIASSEDQAAVGSPVDPVAEPAGAAAAGSGKTGPPVDPSPERKEEEAPPAKRARQASAEAHRSEPDEDGCLMCGS